MPVFVLFLLPVLGFLAGAFVRKVKKGSKLLQKTAGKKLNISQIYQCYQMLDFDARPSVDANFTLDRGLVVINLGEETV